MGGDDGRPDLRGAHVVMTRQDGEAGSAATTVGRQPAPRHLRPSLNRMALAGSVCLLAAIALHLVTTAAGMASAALQLGTDWVASALWASGLLGLAGLTLVLVDLFVLLPARRAHERRVDPDTAPPARIAVALTCYNDETSIAAAVRDFAAHPRVSRVIVVDNNSGDGSAAVAAAAGARVVVESQPGYGHCVFRCLHELAAEDAEVVVLCEGDLTFRARDIDKLAAFSAHADIVNGTRIVEQLRAYDTQLSTFMYYGNFFVGKLLEIKHFGKGTFTDVGTTYKLLHRDVIPALLPELDPRINLEFNAYFMDRVLQLGLLVVECPITFHQRVGVSKGGNASNWRGFVVGLRMIAGLLTDWRLGQRG
jgi:hypothetical protein